jgi:V8-like Glu-specific endopeptidase
MSGLDVADARPTMTHFLDTLPFDWTRPEARELRDFLADVYFREPAVIQIVADAGIRAASIAWGHPMYQVWHEVIEKARNQNKLRALLDAVANNADAAVSVRLRELLEDDPVTAAPTAPAQAPAWKGFDDRDALERRIFDESTLLDIAFLRRGIQLAPAVARLLVTLPSGKYYGTAFRIGDDLLLTNHHVLYDHKAGDTRASAVEIWFGYERDFAGEYLAHEVVMGNPDSIMGAKDHDWAVVRVATAMPAGTPIIDMSVEGRVQPDDRVYIIQHPRGGAKQIGMIHNVVRHVDQNVVQYWTDTEAGSSGSPVFDERWRLVALHHRWVDYTHNGVTEYRNQGRRIERVLDELTAAGVL